MMIRKRVSHKKNDDDDDDKVSVGFLPLSLSILFFFKRTMRVVVYLSPAFMKEEDETGDR